jgi:hypothetical protein
LQTADLKAQRAFVNKQLLLADIGLTMHIAITGYTLVLMGVMLVKALITAGNSGLFFPADEESAKDSEIRPLPV